MWMGKSEEILPHRRVLGKVEKIILTEISGMWMREDRRDLCGLR